jgi:hypothetical protein
VEIHFGSIIVYKRESGKQIFVDYVHPRNENLLQFSLERALGLSLGAIRLKPLAGRYCKGGNREDLLTFANLF